MTERKRRSDRLAATPAPKKDRIVGSARNRSGSASSVSSAGRIAVDAATETALVAKVKEHNEGVPQERRTSLRTLKAVYRRGAGAFSVSHRPGMTRGQWAMGRVNAFLKMLRSGRPDSATYVNDNDLLPRDHPWRKKGTKMLDVKKAGADSAEDMSVPTRRQAARVARMIGCQGAHQHDDGTWMPCATHDEMLSTLEMTKSRRRRQRRGYGAPAPRRFEQLIERGVRGIDTLPGGGLVSAPISAKAGVRGPLGGNRRIRRRARWLWVA